MFMFLDVHDLQGVSFKDIAEAHLQDIAIQAQYDVNYIKYWFNEQTGKVFCLCNAPTAKAAEEVHRCSHGLVADHIIKVDPDMVEELLGGGVVTLEGNVVIGANKPDTALRTVLFTDIVGSTSMTQQLGDVDAIELLSQHDAIIRNLLFMSNGREVKHTGDGIMASFYLAEDAIKCAAQIQHDLTSLALEKKGLTLKVRIGAAAGEPIERHNDLFGSTIQLAARLCAAAEPDEVLISQSVVDLCSDKKIPLHDRGTQEMKGFDEPQRMFSVTWKNMNNWFFDIKKNG